MNTLYVAWKQKDPGGWYPVGRLDVEADRSEYRFRYLRGARTAEKEAGFQPFANFPSFKEDYRSDELFPLFVNRLQNSSRPSFPQYLAQLGVTPEHGKPVDPITLLAISGGLRETDTLEVYPRVELDSGRAFRLRFFLHGLRFLSPHALDATLRLAPGDKLTVAIETNNLATRQAIQFQNQDRVMVGYAPRYLVDDLIRVTLEGRAISTILRVNPPPAFLGERLMVNVEGVWPVGHEPMSGPLYEPVGGGQPHHVEGALANPAPALMARG